MKIETYKKIISTEQYIDEYVNIDEFLEMCKQCREYGNRWSCPPFDFSPLDFWKKYEKFEVVGKKLILEDDEKEKWSATPENGYWSDALKKVKAQLTEEMFALEKKVPDSISLSAGACYVCEQDCIKKTGMPCRFPHKMRYSIEALGGNVGLTAGKLLGVPLQWMTEGELPDYYMLVGGLLFTGNITDPI